MTGAPRHGEAGFALVAVILLMLVVIAAVTPFLLAARTRLDLAADDAAKARLDLLADGLLVVVARDLAAPERLQRSPVSRRSVPARCMAGGVAIEVRVQDQRGLVDLNLAERDALAAGFRALGLGEAEAQAHAAATVQYREVAAPPPEETGAAAMTDPATAGPAAADPASADRAPEPAAATPFELTPFDAPDASLLTDGFKHQPFEAIEELYEFRALQGLPLAVLGEVFTVNAGQADVVGGLMPARLARVLPEAPAAAMPFISEDSGGAATYRVEVKVRGTDATLGFAGALMALTGTDDGGFAPVARTVNPNLLPGGDDGTGDRVACDALFGRPAMAALRGFAA